MLPLRVRVGLRAMATKGYSAFPKLQHYWSLTIRLFSVIYKTLFGGVLPPCSEAVNVFYSPSRLVHRTFVGGVFLFCSEAVSVFNSPCRLGHRTFVGVVLSLCRDTVCVFCSPSRLGHLTKGIRSNQNLFKRMKIKILGDFDM